MKEGEPSLKDLRVAKALGYDRPPWDFDDTEGIYNRVKNSYKNQRRIVTAFSWGYTKQGHNFWSEYHIDGSDAGRDELKKALDYADKGLPPITSHL